MWQQRSWYTEGGFRCSIIVQGHSLLRFSSEIKIQRIIVWWMSLSINRRTPTDNSTKELLEKKRLGQSCAVRGSSILHPPVTPPSSLIFQCQIYSLLQKAHGNTFNSRTGYWRPLQKSMQNGVVNVGFCHKHHYFLDISLICPCSISHNSYDSVSC